MRADVTLKRGLIVSSLLCLIAGLAAAGPSAVSTPQRDVERFLWPRADMRLIDASGHELRPEALRDKVVAVAFFDTGCSAPCALRMLDLAKTAAALPPAARSHVVLLALTGDPARDTPEELARFAKGMGLANEAVALLRGDDAGTRSIYRSIGWQRGASADDVPPSLFVFDRIGQSAMRYDANPLERGRFTRDLASLVSFSRGVGAPPEIAQPTP